MSATYGYLQGRSGTVTRCGSEVIRSELETWDGGIRTVLWSDGTFQVFIGPKHSANKLIAEGNVNDRTFSAVEA